MSGIELTIFGNRTHQKIHSFGASDAWSTQHVGKWEGEEKMEIATLLFDQNLDESGKPKGIGLSCWRILAGAGKQKSDDWRKNECFLKDDFEIRGISDDSSYDFTRCPGQRWFTHAAYRYQVPNFVLFAHSPPAPLTRNNLTYQTSSTCNLRSEKGLLATEFATYLVKVANHFEKLGLKFAAISPVHEPHWKWDTETAEGCSFTNEEIGRIAHSLEIELSNRKLETQVAVPDAGCIDFLSVKITGYEPVSNFVKAYYGDGSLSPPELLRIISGHSYFSCWPQEDRLISSRESLYNAMLPAFRNGAQYWVTEYSVYIPVGESFVPRQVGRSIAPGGRDEGINDSSGIDAALWAARVIHCDLTVANASAWHWWLALSPESVPDGLIRYNDNKQYYPTKSLWALGNYSLFIRPGMTRVELHRSDNRVERECLQDLMTSAYVGKGKIVLVSINMSHVDQDAHIGLVGFGKVLSTATWFASYITSETANLLPYQTFQMGSHVRIPKRSIVTCVSELVEDQTVFHLVAATTSNGKPLCLEVAMGSSTPCAVVGLGTLTGHSHQSWAFTDCGSSGSMKLMASHSRLFLEVVNTSTADKSPLHQNSSSSHDAQRWSLTRQTNGCYYITASHSQAVLEAYGNSVRASRRNGRPEQLWHLVRKGSDIRNLKSNPAVTAVQSAAETENAWAGEWTDELPPAMVPIRHPQKPKGRYGMLTSQNDIKQYPIQSDFISPVVSVPINQTSVSSHSTTVADAYDNVQVGDVQVAGDGESPASGSFYSSTSASRTLSFHGAQSNTKPIVISLAMRATSNAFLKSFQASFAKEFDIPLESVQVDIHATHERGVDLRVLVPRQFYTPEFCEKLRDKAKRQEQFLTDVASTIQPDSDDDLRRNKKRKEKKSKKSKRKD